MYYLPVWFQAIKGDSPVDSGIHLLPLVLAFVVSSILNGLLVSRTGYYTPFLIGGICIAAIGGGLITTFEGTSTSEGKWIGYQIVYGFGLGASIQAPNMAAQTVLPRQDVAIGASLMLFAQQLFGAVFTTVGQNVLDNQLVNRLSGIPGISPDLIRDSGATDLLRHVPEQFYAAAVDGYNEALRVCFQVGLIMTCLALPGALAMECKWCSPFMFSLPCKGHLKADLFAGRSVKKKPAPPRPAETAVAADKGEKSDNQV